MTPLDDILAKREPAPAPDTTQEQTQAKPEGEAKPDTEQPSEGQEAEQPAEGGKPAPIGAIRQAERDKADKRYTAVLDNLRQEIAARDAAWEQRVAKVLEAQKPKAEPRPAPDFYENPNAAVLNTVEPFFSRLERTNLHNSRLIAQQLHGKEVVDAADAEFTKLLAEGKLDPADHQRIVNSFNIYDEAAQWHKRRQAQQEIGPDPVAYKERLRTEMEAEIRAKLEAERETGQQENGNAQQRPAVMPSNLAAARNVGSRSGPAWGGPQSLGDIFNRRREVAKR